MPHDKHRPVSDRLVTHVVGDRGPGPEAAGDLERERRVVQLAGRDTADVLVGIHRVDVICIAGDHTAGDDAASVVGADYALSQLVQLAAYAAPSILRQDA